MKNKKVLAVLGLAVVVAAGGTLAYFNQTMVADNEFDTGKYGSTIVEDFTPGDGDDWQPGAEVNKDVEVINTGDQDVLVRVKFDEKWVNKDNTDWKKDVTGRDGEDVYQADATDGEIEKDGSVVNLTFVNKDKWSFNESDGYWYYKTNVPGGESTGDFLDAVELLNDADMGKYETLNYYTTIEELTDAEKVDPNAKRGDTPIWTQYTKEADIPKNAEHLMSNTVQDATKPGYSNSTYTLTVTAQTIQATNEAVSAVFENNGTDELPETITSGWTLK